MNGPPAPWHTRAESEGRTSVLVAHQVSVLSGVQFGNMQSGQRR